MNIRFLFVILLLILPTLCFSQEIRGKLVDLKTGDPALGVIYINEDPNRLLTESLEQDGSFIIKNLKNISSIKVESAGCGIIILSGYDQASSNNYDIGNIYLLENPHDKIYHVVYKTKIGYYFRWLTEGFRVRKWTRKEINKNYTILREKYKSDGKPDDYLKKYSGHKQILNLTTLNNKI